MNQALGRIFRNHSVFTLIAFLMASIQCSIWPYLTGLKIAPQLWIVFISYFVLHRGLTKAVLLVYFYGFLFSYFSVHPLGFFLLSLLIMTITMSFLKDRLLGPGGSSGLTYSFVSISGFLILWHLSSWSMAALFDKSPAPWNLVQRILETLLTLPFALFLHPIMNYFDTTTDRPSVLATMVTGRVEE